MHQLNFTKANSEAINDNILLKLFLKIKCIGEAERVAKQRSRAQEYVSEANGLNLLNLLDINKTGDIQNA